MNLDRVYPYRPELDRLKEMGLTPTAAETMPRQSYPPIWIPLAVLFGLSLLFRFLSVDQHWEQLLWTKQDGWWLAQNGFVRFLYRYSTWPALFVGVGAGLLWIASQITGRWQSVRPLSLFLCLLLLLGPLLLVNVVFKGNFGRPRPMQTTEFGGTQKFRALGEMGPKEGKSFPSGHASMGFYWLGLFPFFWGRNRKWAWRFCVLGLTCVVTIGLARMAQGSHWPTDVLWSAGFVYLSGWLIQYGIFRKSDMLVETKQQVSLAPSGTDPGDRFSVVVPFYNEAENVRFVLEELRKSLPDAEIVAVDDGSSDRTWEEILQFDGVRGLRLRRNLGQSAAIYHGLHACTREICGLMDGDGQNVPENFHLLLEEFNRSGADVVCGYRAERHDTWSRKIASRLANAIRRMFLSDGVRDTGCSQKVFRRRDVELLVPFRGLHRYLPAIFMQAGLQIREVPVKHRNRRCGVSKYSNWQRALVGIHDLIGVSWLLKRKLPRPQLETKALEAKR